MERLSRPLDEILQELISLAKKLESLHYIKESSDLYNLSDMIRTSGTENPTQQRVRKVSTQVVFKNRVIESEIDLPPIVAPTKHLYIPIDRDDFFKLMDHLAISVPDWRGPFPGVRYLIKTMGNFESQLAQRGYRDYSLVDN